MKKLSLFSVCASILISVTVLISPAIAQTVDLMAYDDGTCGTYPNVHEGQYLRQHFLTSDFGISGDLAVEIVRIYWGYSSGDFAGDIFLRDHDADDVTIYAGSFSAVTQKGWIEYDVSHLNFESDDFYVELWQTVGSGAICADKEVPYHLRSEASTKDPIGDEWHLFNFPEYQKHELDFGIRIAGTDIHVTIDIKPGSYPNCFNINGHGVIPVAILGNADFDVTSIDSSTLSFAGLSVRVRGNKGALCHIEDVSGDFSNPNGLPDGYLDLVCQFEDDPDEWVIGDDEAELTGNLLPEFGGIPINGSDSICVKPE